MPLFTRILCPVDFSDHARHAFEYASALAAAQNASLVALYVHHMAVPVPKSGYSGSLRPVPLSAAERGELQRTLDELVVPARARGLMVETQFEEALVIPRAIVETAQQRATDLIVIGTHGQGGFNRSMLGSVAEKVLHTTTCPVLLVPPPAVEVAFSWRRVLCPVDFSLTSVRALACAAALAEDGASVTVLHVVELPLDENGDGQDLNAYRRTKLEQARTALDRLLQVEGGGRPLDDRLLAGKPSLEILRTSIAEQADVLVIGTQGRGAVDAASFGSTVRHVVRSTLCPVLAVPSAGLAQAASGVSLPRPR